MVGHFSKNAHGELFQQVLMKALISVRKLMDG